MTILNKNSAFIVSRKRDFQSPKTKIFATTALLLAGQAALGADQVTGETAKQLDKVKVEAEALDSGYKADQVSSPKFTQPLKDTPQTIQVITEELFKQQGATTLTEALRNSPGTGTFYVGENGSTNTGDSVFMRGFDTSSSIFVDGVRDLGSISRDLFNIDQVEVAKGPAGTDNGRSAPTGAINLASKSANLDSAISAIAELGSDGQQRVTADVNQALDGLDSAAFRVNLLWQDSDVPGRDHVNNSRVGIAPSLGLGLDSETRIWLNLLYVKQDNIPDGGVPTIALPGWTPQASQEALVGHPVSSKNFYGTRDDHDDVTAQMATVKIEHDFSDQIKVSNILRWGKTNQDYLLSSFMTTAANVSYTDVDDLSTYTLARSNSTFKDQQNKILTDQLNLRVDFITGQLEHSLSTGLEWTREEQTNYTVLANATRDAANLYNPSWNDTSDFSWARNGAIAEGETTTHSFYLFDSIKLSKKLMVVGGLRLDSYDTDYHATVACGGSGRNAVSCGTLPTGSIVESANLQDDDNLFNWKLGAIYSLTEQGNIYLNYALSQQPPGGTNFQLSSSATNANNPNLDPQKAKTLELGTKWELFDDALAVNAAVFRTQVTNELNTQDLDVNGNPSQTGEKEVKGFELGAVGSLSKNWSVSAGYSHLDTSVVEGPEVTKDGTDNLTYTPGDSFTAWTTYNLGSGFTLGGGAIYSGEMHRGTDGAAGTPATTGDYTVFNAVVSYAVNKNLTLRLNAYNLTDEDYVAAINKSGYRYTPGTPRTFLLSADLQF